MIYMTTDEWKEIAKIIEEKDWKELVAEIAARSYDLDVSKQELDRLIGDFVTNTKNNTKNNEEKRLWKIRRLGGDQYESSILELTESEAKKWLRNWPLVPNTLLVLSYRKDEKWVNYEVTN